MNSFWRSRAERVCFHPGAGLPLEAIQGQKCLCCFIGSNSIAFADDGCFESFPVRIMDRNEFPLHKLIKNDASCKQTHYLEQNVQLYNATGNTIHHC